MAFFPFLATVKNSERISPNFQRVTFTGLDDMGPAGHIMDLLIKLVIPGDHGLPKMTGEENWYDEWKAIDPDKRGSMRTYSIRDFVEQVSTTKVQTVKLSSILTSLC